MPDVYEGGIISLQYADDTLLFLENNLQHAKNFKWLLTCFENLSGMRINYAKCDLLTLGLDENENNNFARLFCCKIGSFPIKYLGVPLHFSKLKREDIQPVVDKLIKRVAGWRGKLLSSAGKLTLLKSCLASIPIYLLSVIKFPKWAIESINSQMGNFLWNDNEGKHKYHLSNWPSLTQEKDYGGWGIPDFSSLNLCLLASWINRYHLNEAAIWKKIIDFKYNCKNPNIFCCPELNASPFWKGVLWACKAAHMGVRWKVGDGRTIRFWEDTWVGTCCLATQFSDLYILAEQKNVSLASVWDGRTLKISFRRRVEPRLIRLWEELVSLVELVNFETDCDSIIWTFQGNGQFAVHPMYKAVSFRGIQPVHTPVVWQLNVPPRIHIFLWLMANNKTLTRSNLVKRQNLDDLS